MIDLNKKYKTRDGREVRLFAYEYPDTPATGYVHGMIPRGDGRSGRIHHMWDADTGAYTLGLRKLDLVEVKPVSTRTVWLNIYEDPRSWTLHDSREEADQRAAKARIACLKLNITYEHGQGLTGDPVTE